ncbi:unnamed protein product [Trichogramma brassicae]|uniref:Uncharacterized protein n=1 Tax=Trichogramma brassicae TaxID=86971 RepID=A0A6H5J1H6_9HYME|nr:unnamed protein product [Trichogramma brassicae]
MVLQAVVDARKRFIVIDVAKYGSMSDAGIFRVSLLKKERAFNLRFKIKSVKIPHVKIRKEILKKNANVLNYIVIGASCDYSEPRKARESRVRAAGRPSAVYVCSSRARGGVRKKNTYSSSRYVQPYYRASFAAIQSNIYTLNKKRTYEDIEKESDEEVENKRRKEESDESEDFIETESENESEGENKRALMRNEGIDQNEKCAVKKRAREEEEARERAREEEEARARAQEEENEKEDQNLGEFEEEETRKREEKKRRKQERRAARERAREEEEARERAREEEEARERAREEEEARERAREEEEARARAQEEENEIEDQNLGEFEEEEARKREEKKRRKQERRAARERAREEEEARERAREEEEARERAREEENFNQVEGNIDRRAPARRANRNAMHEERRRHLERLGRVDEAGHALLLTVRELPTGISGQYNTSARLHTSLAEELSFTLFIRRYIYPGLRFVTARRECIDLLPAIATRIFRTISGTYLERI